MKKALKKFLPGSIIEFYRRCFTYKVKCVICKSRFREFEPFGVVPRKNARCKNCGSMERHRLSWKYLDEKTELFTSQQSIKLLHFAPERFFFEWFSQSSTIEYVPCDIEPEKYQYNDKVKIKKIDITNIPFEKNSFDVILCNHVLEHIPDDRRAMNQLYRVMKKGGWGIFQVPIDYSRESTYEDFSIQTALGREKAFGQHDHVRWYGRDYMNRLKEAGFTVIEDDYIKSFSAKEVRYYGLMPSERIYLCRKEK